jgi:hypothetical protein
VTVLPFREFERFKHQKSKTKENQICKKQISYAWKSTGYQDVFGQNFIALNHAIAKESM